MTSLKSIVESRYEKWRRDIERSPDFKPDQLPVPATDTPTPPTPVAKTIKTVDGAAALQSRHNNKKWDAYKKRQAKKPNGWRESTDNSSINTSPKVKNVSKWKKDNSATSKKYGNNKRGPTGPSYDPIPRDSSEHPYGPDESMQLTHNEIRSLVREVFKEQFLNELTPAEQAKQQGLHHLGWGLYGDSNDVPKAKSDGTRLIPLKSTGSQQPSPNGKAQVVTPISQHGGSPLEPEGSKWDVPDDELLERGIGHFVISSQQTDALKKLLKVLQTAESGITVKIEKAPGGLKRYHVFYMQGQVQ